MEMTIFQDFPTPKFEPLVTKSDRPVQGADSGFNEQLGNGGPSGEARFEGLILLPVTLPALMLQCQYDRLRLSPLFRF